MGHLQYILRKDGNIHFFSFSLDLPPQPPEWKVGEIFQEVALSAGLHYSVEIFKNSRVLDQMVQYPRAHNEVEVIVGEGELRGVHDLELEFVGQTHPIGPLAGVTDSRFADVEANYLLSAGQGKV